MTAKAPATARQRALEDPALVPHGTVSGFTYWWCRCGECREAKRMTRAASKARCKQRDGLPLTDFDREVLGLVSTP